MLKLHKLKEKIKLRSLLHWASLLTKPPTKNNSYILSVLTKITIFIHQLRHLFLQPIVLLHQQLIHCSQLPIYSLQPRRLLSLLLSTSEQLTKTKQSVTWTNHHHNFTNSSFHIHFPVPSTLTPC